MVLYSYSARNAKGERVHGSIDAADVTAARIALAEQALLPEEVFQISYETKNSTDFSSAPQQNPTPAKAVQSPPPAAPVQKQPPAQPTPASAASVNKPITIPPPREQAPAHDWAQKPSSTESADTRQYYPFLDTLRLYAGWLLAWYALVYALGAYTTTRSLPFEIPYLMGIYASPLVLSFTLASFLFLAMTSLYKKLGTGTLSALFCTIVGVLAFVFYRVNV
jgi:hypothetical protein